MKINKRYVVVLIFMITIAVGYMYYKPVKLNYQYSSVIYSIESDFEKETIIEIEGLLYKRIFAKNVVIGELTVDYDLSYDFRLKFDGRNYFYVLSEVNEATLRRSIGTITLSKNFDKVWLMLTDIDERYDTKAYVFGPADNGEEANRLVYEMLKFQNILLTDDEIGPDALGFMND